jgi:peroxiredoxin
MSRKLAWILALAAMSTSVVCAQEKKSAAPPKLKIGDMAPNFKLQFFDGKELKDVTLDQYRGKQNVVLAFYIFAFTGG